MKAVKSQPYHEEILDETGYEQNERRLHTDDAHFWETEREVYSTLYDQLKEHYDVPRPRPELQYDGGVWAARSLETPVEYPVHHPFDAHVEHEIVQHYDPLQTFTPGLAHVE